jgi:bifunctional non-homologous end joining protein LigD
MNAASGGRSFVTTHDRPLRFVRVLAILVYTVSLHFQPMPLLKRAAPFDDPGWIFELKYDGFRALAVIEHGRAQLLSRNGHPFASFSALAESISDSLPNAKAVIDGEICCLDRRGRPQFKNLLFHRGDPPCFFAFDLLTCDGKDLRTERLLDRRQELRRLLARSPATSPLKYTEYIDGQGTALFQRICDMDLEGIVAKQKSAPYVTEREHSTWFKILNREYSQKDGREKLFERERHSEPVAGWHCCAIACAELES